MDCSNTQKRRIKGWAEEDAYTPCRRLYPYLSRAGAVKGIKRATHRRERREAEQEIAEELDAYYV